MNFSLVTEAPIWFSIFCLLAGLACATLLYYRDARLSELKATTRYLLAFFRFCSISILAFLLLGPLLKTMMRQVEKPVIVVAQDNSESLLIGKNADFYRAAYKEQLNQFIAKLAEKYEVRSYGFGEKLNESIPFTYTDKLTDMSGLLAELETRYANRNLGAVVIASDGIYNMGEDPVLGAEGIHAPIYTLALGDTIVKKDALIAKVRHNKTAYFGNTFPLEVYLEARQLKGIQLQLSITKDQETLFTQSIQSRSEKFSLSIPIQLSAKEKGIQHYRISLNRVAGEVTYTNNVRDVFIEVLDGREKILILAASPHPDIAAMKQAIESNENYQVDYSLASDFNGNFAAYNLVVMHQLPAESGVNPRLNAELAKNETPLLFVIGNQSNLMQFNALNAGLSISGGQAKANESQAILDKSFSLFTLSDACREFIPQLPPLHAPFGNYSKSNATTAFLNQKIGSVATDYPLILFRDLNGKKTAVIAGEGIWRWRLADYEQHHNLNLFNEIINKTVQYLSVKVDKSLFRILTKNNFTESEALQFDAELYNESYELINEPEVSLTIRNAEGKSFPFAFSKTENAYRLSTNSFPAGEYSYEAKAKVGDKILSYKGKFTVSPIVVESVNTTADHQLLYTLAKKHQGEMFDPDQLEQLTKALLTREDIKSLSFSEKKTMDLIHLKWVFFLLLALLSVEWFLRKRNGTY